MVKDTKDEDIHIYFEQLRRICFLSTHAQLFLCFYSYFCIVMLITARKWTAILENASQLFCNEVKTAV